MTLRSCALLWVATGKEEALTAYLADSRRLTLADIHRRVVARTELLRVTTIV